MKILNDTLIVACLTSTAALALASRSLAASPEIQSDERVATQVEGGLLEEIMVTAQKRSESLQDVPLNITYVGSDQLARQNVVSFTGLATTAPSLQIGTQIVSNVVTIRGIGTSGFARSAEQAAGVVLDGVVLGRGVVDALFDIDHVEVLNGPQGTLFGKNATAGVVSIVTRAPKLDTYEFIGHADIGTPEYRNIQATVNAPLGDTAAMRIGVIHSGTGHTIYNDFLDQWDRNELWGTRGRLLWEPSSDLRVNLIGDYSRATSNGISYTGAYTGTQTIRAVNLATQSGQAMANLLQTECGLTPHPGSNRTCTDGAGGDRRAYRVENFGFSGQIDYSLRNHDVTSITAYRAFRNGDFDVDTPALETDGLPIDVFNRQLVFSKVDTFSQELRIASSTGRSFEYVAGLFYSSVDSADHTDQGGGLNVMPPGLILRRVSRVDISSSTAAAFGQIKWNFADALHLILGGRYTHDEFHDVGTNSTPGAFPDGPNVFDPGFQFLEINESKSYDNLSWKVGLNYDVSPDVMVYATVARGYKAGFANDTLSAGSFVPVMVKPEFPTAFELGVKSSFLDDRLAVNLALFHTRIKNFQTAIVVPPSEGSRISSYGTGNSPYATTYGVDLSVFGKPANGLTLSAAVAYNRAKYAENFLAACDPSWVDPTTNLPAIPACTPFSPETPAQGVVAAVDQLPNAPKWKMVVSGEYEHPLTDSLWVFAQADVNYRSEIHLSEVPDINRLGDQTRLGARVGVRSDDDRWGVALFGRNLNQKRFLTGMYRGFFSPNDILFQTYTPDSSRVVGVTLDVRF